MLSNIDVALSCRRAGGLWFVLMPRLWFVLMPSSSSSSTSVTLAGTVPPLSPLCLFVRSFLPLKFWPKVS